MMINGILFIVSCTKLVTGKKSYKIIIGLKKKEI